MKCRRSGEPPGEPPSLPVRGAWIEIWSGALCMCADISSRSPCGERGLKCGVKGALRTEIARRSPCGERGLKCDADGFCVAR